MYQIKLAHFLNTLQSVSQRKRKSNYFDYIIIIIYLNTTQGVVLFVWVVNHFSGLYCYIVPNVTYWTLNYKSMKMTKTKILVYKNIFFTDVNKGPKISTRYFRFLCLYYHLYIIVIWCETHHSWSHTNQTEIKENIASLHLCFCRPSSVWSLIVECFSPAAVRSFKPPASVWQTCDSSRFGNVCQVRSELGNLCC